MAAADRALLALLGPRAWVVILPTAADRRPDLAGATGVAHFRSLGADAEAVLITDRATAHDDALVNQLAAADLVYMAGGNPRHLLESLRDTPAWETLRRRWREGMALGGSSAGAMVLCQAMLFQGKLIEALSLVPRSAVLPHFERRDAGSAEAAHKIFIDAGLVGVGIDESTALVWAPDGGWRVAGRGKVEVLSSEPISQYWDGGVVASLPPPTL